MREQPEVLLRLPSAVDINAVVWICALSEDEKRPTERVHDDLHPYLLSRKIQFRSYEPKSANEFLDTLRKLEGETLRGLLPIIVVDSHGTDGRGIVIQETKEVIGWKQFVELLRPINVATKNNLCVLSAACFSFQSIFEVSILEPVPYFIFIAAEREFFFVEKEVIRFFIDVFDNDNIVSAHKKNLSSQTRLFHCEGALLRALVIYIREHCIGPGFQRRKEGILSEAIRRGMPNTRHERRRARKFTAQKISPTQSLIDGFVQRFLVGKQMKVTIAGVMRLVRLKIKSEEERRVGFHRHRG